MTTSKTKSQQVAAEIAALLRARNPLLWVVTREEARVEGYLFEAAASARYIARTWDCAQGVCTLDGRQESFGGPDIGATLETIRARAQASTADRGVWILRDLPVWVDSPLMALTRRQVRNLARFLPTQPQASAQAMIVITPTKEVPPELAAHAKVVEWPMPDRAEITSILDAAIDALPEDLRASAAPNGKRDAAIDAAVGLSGEEAQACYAQSLVQLRRIDPSVVTREKKRIIARERVLEWHDPLPGGLASVGGLENLKAWLQARTNAYSAEARAYGLPAPKGVFLAGITGCGKSLTSKAIATTWGVPLLRIDLGALKSKFVGESEGNLRRAFSVIEAIGRCVVWLDEVEKALQGATSGSADGGVSSDALGAILTWMQERRTDAFVIATANDIEGLPPEFLRKGRFDEVFWLDCPNASERVEVLRAALREHGRDPEWLSEGNKVDLVHVAQACTGFTGSEIAAIVPDALFAAFNEGARELQTGDLVAAAKTVVPITRTAAEKIKKLRDWAADRARYASRAPEVEQRASVRAIDLDR